MMDVRVEHRGACSPGLRPSQTSRHAVPTSSTGVFSVFVKDLTSLEVEGGHAAGGGERRDDGGEDGDDDVKHPLEGFLSTVFHNRPPSPPCPPSA